MTHANHPHFDLAILQAHAQSQTGQAPTPVGARGSSTSERTSLLGGLPLNLICTSTQPPAWWLDKRAKLDAGNALAC